MADEEVSKPTGIFGLGDVDHVLLQIEVDIGQRGVLALEGTALLPLLLPGLVLVAEQDGPMVQEEFRKERDGEEGEREALT